MKVVLTTVRKYSMRYRHNTKKFKTFKYIYSSVTQIHSKHPHPKDMFIPVGSTSKDTHNISLTSERQVFTNIQILVFTNIRPPKDHYKTTVWNLCCPSARGFLSGSPSAVEAKCVAHLSTYKRNKYLTKLA